MKEGDKLYLITRSDLKPGYQGVQACHAAFQFCFEHPDFTKEWFEKSNYLGFLSVKNEDELVSLINKAQRYGINFSIFREPDIGNEVTAIALEPSPISKKLCSALPLALSE